MREIGLFLVLLAAGTAGMPLPFEKDGSWGYESPPGKPVISSRFIIAGSFNEHGIAAVLDSTGWQFIDTTGKTVIRPLVVDNGPDYFHSGLARFSRDGKVGFFDESGRTVIPATFNYVRPFSGTRAAFCSGCTAVKDGEHTRITGGSWGFIDLTGKPVVPPSFTEAHNFADGQAQVKKGDWWQCIDTAGVKADCLPDQDEEEAPAQVPDPALAAVRNAAYPEQRIAGDPVFEASSIREAKLLFKDCLQPVLTRAAELKPGSEPDTVLTGQCRDCYRKYYQSMKGNTNITFRDLDEALRWMAGKNGKGVFGLSDADLPLLIREVREGVKAE